MKDLLIHFISAIASSKTSRSPYIESRVIRRVYRNVLYHCTASSFVFLVQI